MILHHLQDRGDSDLGPLRLDRRQYETAIAEIPYLQPEGSWRQSTNDGTARRALQCLTAVDKEHIMKGLPGNRGSPRPAIDGGEMFVEVGHEDGLATNWINSDHIVSVRYRSDYNQ